MQMDKIINFLDVTIKVGENSISIGGIFYIIGFLIAGIIFIRWSIRYLEQQMSKRKVNPDLAQMLSRTYIVVIIGVLFICSLDILNVPLTAFAFISGAVAIGVGFGAQNIINNFISGWILMWERPIRIGDFLEICDVKGTVESINTRSTRIKRVDGVHMLIPNSYLLENVVTNWTLVDRLTRTTVRVGIAYGSEVKLARELMLQVANEYEHVLKDPAPACFFEDFGDSALIFDLNIWVNAIAERNLKSVRSDLRFRIEELFRENNISIAFPQRDLHIDGSLLVRRE
jgi:small-conductance mechanosensitive channel